MSDDDFAGEDFTGEVPAVDEDEDDSFFAGEDEFDEFECSGDEAARSLLPSPSMRREGNVMLKKKTS